MAQLQAGSVDCVQVSRAGHRHCRPDSGGKPGASPGGSQIRRGQKDPVLDLCHLLDTARHRAGNCQPQPHDSVHPHGRITLVSQAKARWLAEFGRPPTRQELSVETGLPEKEIDLITRYSGPQGVESLDAPLKGGDDDEPPTLATFLASDEPGIEDETITADIRQIVTEAMGVLTPRECRILEERFGLREDDTEGKKLHEIAAKFGLTRERIRQVQQDALQRLAKDDRLKGLHYD